MSDWPSIVSMAVPAAAGLIGVLIGAWLSETRKGAQRRLAFYEQQLSGFYSPMAGLRDETRMLTELRIRDACNGHTSCGKMAPT